MDASSGFGNHVILLMPQMLTTLPSSTTEGHCPCSAGGYTTSFQAKILPAALSKSSKGMVLAETSSGMTSDRRFAGCVKDLPPASIKPNKSNSSEVTLTFASFAAKQQLEAKASDAAGRTNANKDDDASFPRSTTDCGDSPAARWEEPRGECLGDDPPVRSELGHISVDKEVAFRWRWGL
eukprot:CAMPEP_0178421144 /NCGR_PEP_ID=MMETSP0689_2-20121128/26497_1 /TAXON_ID=160604 /ORGANISM="Amphidinium massartii, Strain CS-259" /LENGTH=179 /DNA_ID=CAMNT_0020042649 /DNA_START=666 /DNA_END=1206 /DNA_ORIENTATION=-